MLFIQSLLAGLFSVFSMGEPGFYADVLLPTDEGIARDWEAVGGDVLPGVYHYGQEAGVRGNPGSGVPV